MNRILGLSLGALIVGFIVGALLIWVLGPFGAVEPRVVEGQVTAVSDDAEGISLAIEGEENTTSYVVAGAFWQRDGLPWQDSFPTCIESGSVGQQVRLGVVDVAETDDAPGRTVVVWVQCLSTSG